MKLWNIYYPFAKFLNRNQVQISTAKFSLTSVTFIYCLQIISTPITLFILKITIWLLHFFLYNTGVLSLSVCIVVIENFSNHDKGWALFVSLISACIQIVNVSNFAYLNKKCLIAFFSFYWLQLFLVISLTVRRLGRVQQIATWLN